MGSSPVKLRIHHLMCVHGFKGKGYSPEFVSNFWRVIDDLEGEGAFVEVVSDTTDSICAPCPNNQGKSCADDAKISKLDGAYEKTLSIKPGARLSWNSVRDLVAEKVSLEDFEKNCEPCAWKKLGHCREALSKLKGLSVVLALVASLLSTSAFAADPVSKTIALDELEAKITLDKSKRVPAFGKVLSALQRNDFNAAIEAAKPLERNEEFADYYHFLAAQAELGRAKKALDNAKAANTALSCEQARYHLVQAQGANPYTGLSRRIMALWGKVEVTLAEAQLRLKKKQKAQQAFEDGFQRLSQSGQLMTVSKTNVLNYALLCEKLPNDLCGGWLSRLTPLLSRTEDIKLVERIAANKKPAIEKSTQVPYRVDLDLQAFQKGYASYLEGKYNDAYLTWLDLLKNYPRTTIKLRTKFWMARAAQKTKHDTHAETLFREVIRELPFSYYALLSSWFGGIDIARMMDAEVPVATTEAPGLTPADAVRVKRAETLIASGAPELARYELSEVRPNSTMPNEFVVYLTALNHLAGNHQSSFQLFGELSTRNYQGLFSSYGQKILFPSTKLPLIRDISKESRVDPLLVISIIKQESAFNEDAVSSANAFGLMQIIAPTARELQPDLDLTNLFNAAHNIKLGSRYIGQMLRRFNGNVIYALAAYNAGPGNAERWRREAKNLPQEEYIENITYRETREYVQNILRNYYWYSRRVKGEPIASLASLVQGLATTAEAAPTAQEPAKNPPAAAPQENAPNPSVSETPESERGPATKRKTRKSKR